MSVKAASTTVLLAVALTACSRAPQADEARKATLSEGVAAVVGGSPVYVASVARVAKAQKIPAKEARDRLVHDALFAAQARATRLDGSLATDGVLARRLLLQLYAAADAQGPVTDAELAEATERYWLGVDRPAGARTVHAVLRVDPSAPPEKKREAEAIAERIRARALELAELARTTSPPVIPWGAPGNAPEDPLAHAFIEAANGVEHPGIELVAQSLAPVAADGRVLSADRGSFAAEYAHAANALVARGDVSPPTWSPFGVHVIVLLEQTPAEQFPTEERRRRVRDTVLKDRARVLEHALITELRPAAVVEHAADAMLAEVPVAP